MTTPLDKKLQITPGTTVHILNIPDDVKPWLILELIHYQIEYSPSDTMKAIILFIKDRLQLEQSVYPLLAGLNEKSLVWLAYPKATSVIKSDINREILWKSLRAVGWRPSHVMALDDCWSCMRFRPINEKN
jgi:hypothetical protein